jgi:hypothetical protein
MKTNRKRPNRVEAEYISAQIREKIGAIGSVYDEVGLLLIDLKSKLPHGQFTPWVDSLGINPKTSSRWMAEARDPNKAEQRRSDQNERSREVMEAKQRWDEFQEKTVINIRLGRTEFIVKRG